MLTVPWTLSGTSKILFTTCCASLIAVYPRPVRLRPPPHLCHFVPGPALPQRYFHQGKPSEKCPLYYGTGTDISPLHHGRCTDKLPSQIWTQQLPFTFTKVFISSQVLGHVYYSNGVRTLALRFLTRLNYASFTFQLIFLFQPWIASWLDLVGELEIYVQKYHQAGLKWNI